MDVLKKNFWKLRKLCREKNADDHSFEYYEESIPEPRNIPAGLKGLKNFGNNCFMNSSIQCLSNTHLLLEFILNDTYLNYINYTTSATTGNLTKSFAFIIKDIWSPVNKQSVTIWPLKIAMGEYIPNFDGTTQQDAQEFMRYFLQGLHEELNYATNKTKAFSPDFEPSNDYGKGLIAWAEYTHRNKSKLSDIFVGQLKSMLQCSRCGYRSVNFEPFWDLALPIPQSRANLTLSECLQLLIKKETLLVNCETCNKETMCFKHYTINKLPKVLVIYVKRYAIVKGFYRSKVNCFIDYPLAGWDLKNFTESRQSCIYNLYAVCNHSGTMYCGHYTSYCRHPHTKDWYKFDDSKVSALRKEEIVNDQAYILFYQLQE